MPKLTDSEIEANAAAIAQKKRPARGGIPMAGGW